MKKIILFSALAFASLMFTSCDKGDATCEVVVTYNGNVKVQNYPVTLKSSDKTYTVSSNLDGIAFFTGLNGGNYTMSWQTATIVVSGRTITLNGNSKEVAIQKGQANEGYISF